MSGPSLFSLSARTMAIEEAPDPTIDELRDESKAHGVIVSIACEKSANIGASGIRLFCRFDREDIR